MTFSSELLAATRKIEADVNKAVTVVSNDLFGHIQMRTPVDTGRLRQGWQIEKTKDGYRIFNALPYAEVVEFGGYKGVGGKTVSNSGGIYSRQAPTGMVRVSIADIKVKYELH
jgi:hypothetical protein